MPWRIPLALLVAFSAFAAGAAAAGAHPFPRMPSNCRRSDYSSAGAVVRAALCLPPGRTPAPVAIVLHGCGGFDTFDHRLAVELPRAGIATLYVDYFEPTPPTGTKGYCSGGGRGSFQDVFSVWQREVIDAVFHLRHVPGVKPNRVALVGWSLGGGLALSVARERPDLFRALVGFSTGLFGGGQSASFRSMPPALVLSGGPADAIPLDMSEALVRALRDAGDRASLYDYGHGVHRWPGAQGTAGIAAAARFLRGTLRDRGREVDVGAVPMVTTHLVK